MKKTKKHIGLSVLMLLLIFTTSYVSITDIYLDSIEFKTVKIGNQTWTTENLNTSLFNNGESIPFVKTEEEWYTAGKAGKPVCCYYNFDPVNGKKYGKLYNWYAVNDTRGLAPLGWHIPTQTEWTILINYLGEYTICSKIKSTIDWPKKSNGKNESGFSALPSGNGPRFASEKLGAWWWTSTDYSKEGAYTYYIYYDKPTITRSPCNKHGGYSVRCIKD